MTAGRARSGAAGTWAAARSAAVGSVTAICAFLRRRTGTLSHPSRWAWAADIAIAVSLAAATWYTAANPTLPDDGEPWPLPALPATGPGIPPLPAFPDPGDLPPASDGLWAAGDAPILLLALAAVCVLPLAWRRRFPLGAFAAVLVLTVAFHARYDTGVSPDGTTVFTFAAVLLAGFSAGLYSPFRNAALAAIGVGVVAIAAMYETNVPAIGPVYVPLFLVLALALGANAIHGWKQRLRTAQAEHHAAATRALRAERARIARELHDVVTHHVSIMVIQAGAARVTLRSSADTAGEILHEIERSGREAMTELRNVVGLLADPDDVRDTDDQIVTGGSAGTDADDEALVPQPGIDRLPALVARIRSAGIPVDLHIEGHPAELPAGVELAAYRVAQEALTNILKHAAGAAAQVQLVYDTDQLRIRVNNSPGARRPAADTGGGRGLLGLRERLAVYGGSLQAGPAPGGGYAVRAQIPMSPA